MATEVALSDLIFGSQLHTRAGPEGDRGVYGLDPAVRGVAAVLKRELGPDDPPCSQALLEWGRISELPLDYDGVAARRAALLFALWREPDVQDHYRRSEPELVDDLCTRILPLVCPRFLANQAQSPDVLVAMVSVLWSMWDAGDLGAARPRVQERAEETHLELTACAQQGAQVGNGCEGKGD